jgi:hypothetical protein
MRYRQCLGDNRVEHGHRSSSRHHYTMVLCVRA